jgi:hypothetical protein
LDEGAGIVFGKSRAFSVALSLAVHEGAEMETDMFPDSGDETDAINREADDDDEDLELDEDATEL